ncbi:hypothetical protein AHAS_Ahas14G0017700 [Arachis hypogaea]
MVENTEWKGNRTIHVRGLSLMDWTVTTLVIHITNSLTLHTQHLKVSIHCWTASGLRCTFLFLFVGSMNDTALLLVDPLKIRLAKSQAQFVTESPITNPKQQTLGNTFLKASELPVLAFRNEPPTLAEIRLAVTMLHNNH